jgi:DNA-binding transcriptional LysR family regulator
LILQPEVLLADDIAAGRLVPVLQSHVPAARPVNIVYLRDRRPRRKLMSLVEYLLERMGEPANA